MPLLNTADAVYVGDVLADAVYMGDTLVWSSAPPAQWGPLETMYQDNVNPGGPADPNAFSLGNKFTVLAEGRITGARIFHLNNSPMRADRPVTLWTLAGVKVAEALTVGEVNGWNVIEFPTPVTVAAGDEFVMSWGYYGAGVDGSFAYSANFEMGNSANLRWDAGRYSPAPSDPAGFPPSDIVPNQYYADVVFQENLNPVAFDPALLSGCIVDLDARDLPAGPVNWWTDRSPAHHDMAPWLAQPIASGEYVSLSPASPLGTQVHIPISGQDPSHLFFVVRSRRLLGSSMGWGSPYNGGLWDIFQTDLDMILWHGYGAGYSQGDQPYTPNEWHIVDLSYDGALSVKMAVDGAPPLGSDNVAGINTASYYLRLGMGQYEVNADFDLSEIILYDRKLSDEERAQVREHLQLKWQVQNYFVARYGPTGERA